MRLVLTCLLLFGLNGSALAQGAAGWDGTWTGAWGGQAPTTVLIVGGRVVEYTYQGQPQGLTRSSIKGNQASFGNSTFTVTLFRKNSSTVAAQWQNTQGRSAAATLIRQ